MFFPIASNLLRPRLHTHKDFSLKESIFPVLFAVLMGQLQYGTVFATECQRHITLPGKKEQTKLDLVELPHMLFVTQLIGPPILHPVQTYGVQR